MYDQVDVAAVASANAEERHHACARADSVARSLLVLVDFGCAPLLPQYVRQLGLAGLDVLALEGASIRLHPRAGQARPGHEQAIAHADRAGVVVGLIVNKVIPANIGIQIFTSGAVGKCIITLSSAGLTTTSLWSGMGRSWPGQPR